MTVDPSGPSHMQQPGGQSALVSVSNRAGCCGLIVAVLLGAGGFFAWPWLRPRLDRLEGAARNASAAVTSAAGEASAAIQVAAGDAPPREELAGGQVLEGDFEVSTLEQALAAGEIERALSIAIELDPEKLRAHLADGTFDPNLKLHGSDGYYALPLEEAVRHGAPGTVQILLAAGADPNGLDSDRGSALASASYQGRVDLVRALLAAGADPNLAGQNDSRAIDNAAYQGHLEAVRTLLDGGSGLHFALHSASSSGNLELVTLLLDAGADPRARTPYDESALRGAAREGHLEIVERLLAAGTRPCELALREAAHNGRVEVLRALGRAGVRFDTPPAQWDPLYMAAYYGQAETVRVLVELGASPSGYRLEAATHADYPPTALGAARAQGHGEVAALLESLGAR